MFEVQRGSSRAISGAAAPGQSHVMFGNRLLDSLPREDVGRLSPHLRRVFLHRGQIVASPESLSEFALFPIDALVWTWQATTDSERPTSLLTVGRRGLLPLDEVMGVTPSATSVVLSPGSAWRLPLAVFESSARTIDAPLRRLVSRFGYAAFASASYRLACNSEHNVDRRLARWLLFIMDETGKPEASLTHQQIADIAAIRRPSVSLAFSDLQRRGIVRVHHGLVQIIERERLEREACPCYISVRDVLDDVVRSNDVSASV